MSLSASLVPSGRFRILLLTAAIGTSLLSMSTAQAQSNATGSIFGSGGAPGAAVVIENLDTGVTREVKIDANGRYAASALPVGRYKVTLQKDGQSIASKDDVNVVLGAGSEVSFGGEATTSLEGIVVTASSISPIDVSQADTRRVFTADVLTKLPIAHNITNIALLAPGVVQADSRYAPRGYGATASFSGSAASENAIYINGYPVTNPLTNLGSTSLPYDAINQAQVITGGYGAEFGRSTGGVINIVTKSGTNEFHAGGQVLWAPDGLRAEQRNIYIPRNGTANDGKLYQNYSARTDSSTTYGAYASGPIVKDNLFFYVGAEFTDRSVDSVAAFPGSTSAYGKLKYDVPRYNAKLDWNITNDHLLEFTAVHDVSKQWDKNYSYYYNEANAEGLPVLTRGSTQNAGYYYKDGGNLYIGKYTGYLTDNLTLTALYGRQSQDHIANPWGYDPSVVYVDDSRSIPNPIRFGNYLQIPDPSAYDKTKGGRLDLEWRIGSHTARFGYDRIDLEVRQGTATSGPGYAWRYATLGPIDEPTPIPGGGGAVVPVGNGDYVSRYVYANGGTFSVKQAAYYLEDRWQLTDNWLLSLGVRNEKFRNFNADGIVYVEQKNQWAPRLGASWDVNGDSSLKVFGNIGRYHLAMPANVALRGAAGSLYTNEYFTFTGVDPSTGAPQGLTPIGNGPYSSNQEYGQAPNPASVAAKGLKPHYQDEFVLGFEKQLTSSLNGGARYVLRDLKNAIDDMCDGRPARRWALAHGYSEEVAENLFDELANCRLFNPGKANTFQLDDGTGNLITVPLTAAELGFPKLKRMYQGIDFFLEQPFDGTWYWRVDYTWSRNYGNAEGQLNSDIGQGDVSQTQVWDHPELMYGANGYLPNDRRHFIKAVAAYKLTPEWAFSGAASFASGRPKNCTGYYNGPDPNGDVDEVLYSGPYYWFCDGQLSPRGSRGRMPWTRQLDLGVTYSPKFADNKLTFRLDVLNVFNSQVAQNRVEYGELGGPGVPYQYTGRVISYSAPRYARLGIRYDF